MSYNVSMFIDIIPNRNSKPTTLLREAWRDGKKTFKRTVANISHWPQAKVNALRAVLQNKPLVPRDELFAIEKTIPHGHVKAILGTIKKLGLDKIISSKPCKERDLAVALIADRLLHPCSKLATSRMLNSTTLGEELSITNADEDDLYEAMDWLLKRQSRIENKLAKSHLLEESLVLYDVSSSYYEGHTCPLIAFGHNKDKKAGKKIIVYGVMTDPEGRPVAVDVYPGNTGDPSTVEDQTNKLRDRFKLSRIILVGDRGMLTQTQIDTLENYPGIGWISALRSESIRELAKKDYIQLSLFDKQDLAEISSPDFPGERLIVCYNPILAERRHYKRISLLEATEKKLDKVVNEVNRRTRKTLKQDEIGIKVGKILDRYKVGKHFKLTIKDNYFKYERNQEAIEQESKIDGIYVIRTSEPKATMSAEDTVRNYKSLSLAERSFRCMKGVDILVRPIRHYTEDRVRAHIFICMLTYYVEWHMRKALAPLLFDDEELDHHRQTRDPVKPAATTDSAKMKKKVRKTKDGLPIHSFSTLLVDLGTLCKNKCRIKSSPDEEHFYQETEMSSLQKKAFNLLGL